MSLGRLGLSEESFDNLAKRVDIILHNGALLHWLMSYEKLRVCHKAYFLIYFRILMPVARANS